MALGGGGTLDSHEKGIQSQMAEKNEQINR